VNGGGNKLHKEDLTGQIMGFWHWLYAVFGQKRTDDEKVINKKKLGSIYPTFRTFLFFNQKLLNQ